MGSDGPWSLGYWMAETGWRTETAPPQAQGIWRPPRTYLAAALPPAVRRVQWAVPLHLFTGNHSWLGGGINHHRLPGIARRSSSQRPSHSHLLRKTDSWVFSSLQPQDERTVSFTLWVGDIHRWWLPTWILAWKTSLSIFSFLKGNWCFEGPAI